MNTVIRLGLELKNEDAMNINGYFFGPDGDPLQPRKDINIKTLDWLWLW